MNRKKPGFKPLRLKPSARFVFNKITGIWFRSHNLNAKKKYELNKELIIRASCVVIHSSYSLKERWRLVVQGLSSVVVFSINCNRNISIRMEIFLLLLNLVNPNSVDITNAFFVLVYRYTAVRSTDLTTVTALWMNVWVQSQSLNFNLDHTTPKGVHSTQNVH